MNDDDDQGFFILVLGVLAAILMVVIWGFINNGANHRDRGDHSAVAVAEEAHDDAEDDHGDDEEAEEAEAAPEPTPEPEPEPEPTPEPVIELPSTVFEAASNNGQLGVLTGLLRSNGLDSVLSGDGPFTLFAPTDDAANNAAASDVTVGLLENAPESVLTYHVVPGAYSQEDIAEIAASANPTLETVQGEILNFAVDGDSLVINGTSVIGEAQEADNGVLHTIDNVLVPPVATLNSIVGLEPILFATGSAEIDPASFPTLDAMTEILSANAIDVTVEGHTDNTGDAAINQALSQERARSVVNYLVVNGIDESRLSAVGFGPDQPVADNDTEEGRALNRRIEFALSE